MPVRRAVSAACLLALAAAGIMLAQTPAAQPRQRRFSTGPNDQHAVDAAAADRGKKVYAAECIHCHGTNATGGERGADLIRSLVVLKDRYGDKIGPFLKNNHPTQTTPAAKLTDEQIGDLSHWLHSKVIGSLRSNQDVGDILTGDAKAGEAYFNGEGKCNTCHSPAGDFAHIGRRYNPVTLQQRFLFPNAGGFGRRRIGSGSSKPPKPVTVSVTKDGKTVTGTLVRMDDFSVSLRDESGEYQSFKRTAAVTVVKNDPKQYHIDMLPKFTDQQMHDVVAYLESIR